MSPTPASTQHHLKPKSYVWQQCPNATWALAALSHAHCTGSLCHAHRPLLQNVFYPPAWPSLTHPHAVQSSVWGAVGHHEAEQTQWPQLLLTHLDVRSYHISIALLWTLTISFMSFLRCGTHTCTQCSRWGHAMQSTVGQYMLSLSGSTASGSPQRMGAPWPPGHWKFTYCGIHFVSKLFIKMLKRSGPKQSPAEPHSKYLSASLMEPHLLNPFELNLSAN